MRIATVTETCSADLAGTSAALQHLACHAAGAQASLLDVAPAALLQLREAMRRVASAHAHAAVTASAGRNSPF